MTTTQTQITREELFRQVWETPMSRLALRYGITGNGLAKACDRLKVPYPPRGWWAKKAAGKKVAYYRLPEADADTPTTTTITRTTRHPEVSAEAKEAVVRAAIGDDEIRVPDTLRAPHPIVAKWVADYERRLQDARRDRSTPNRVYIERITWSETDRRRHRILNTLFKEGEKRGLKAKEDGYVVYFETAGERLNFKLREKQRQIRRPKTEDEKRWSSAGRDWAAELKPSGLLTFSIETHVPGLPQRTWNETAGRRLEEDVGEILAATIASGPILAKQRREREEAERLRLLEERRRYEEAEKKRVDDNRWRRFMEFAVQWSEVEVARKFVEAVEAKVTQLEKNDEQRAIVSWLPWLRERLEQHDPLHTGVRDVFLKLSAVTSWTYPRC